MQLQRDGVRIYYESHGSGPPLLLSHGHADTSHMWSKQVAALAGDHRLLAWDLRGHGESDSPQDPAAYSEEASVQDMVAILDDAGVERAVLAGHSLGGYLSLACCLAHPQRVSALILISTGPGYRNPQARAEWNERAEASARRFEEGGLEALGRGARARGAEHRSAQGLVHSARGMLAQFDSRVMDALGEIAVPTLVLVGENDQAYHAASGYMEERMPHARKVVVEDAGHTANFTRPEAVNAAIQEFLASL